MSPTSNVFRFVSVRPPKLEDAAVRRRLENREAGASFVAAVERRMREHDEPLVVARRKVSADVLASDEYFARHQSWRQLRPSRRALVALLEEAASGADWAYVRQRAEEIVLGVFPGNDLPDWLGGETYGDLRRTLWRSYYANALVDEVRPHDRPEMLAWARIFGLLEVFRDDDRSEQLNDDEKRRRNEWLADLARMLLRARLLMPVQLFQEPTPVEAEREQPPEPTDARIAELREALARRERAQAQLEDLYRSRVTRLRRRPVRAEPANDLRPNSGAEEGRPAGAGDDRPDGTGGGLDPADAPWRMSEEDLASRDELRAELERLHLPPDGALVTEVAAQLDATLARDIIELQALVTDSDVLGFGRTLAVIGRTRRSLLARPDAERPR